MAKRILTQPTENGSVDRAEPDKPARIVSQEPVATPTSTEAPKVTATSSLTEPEEKTPAQPDAYDMASLLLDPEDGDDLGLTHETVSVGFCKPKSSWWFRVYPEPPKIVRLLTVEEEGELGKEQYLIAPALARHPKLAMERAMRRARLYRCINRAGEIFLWPVKMAGPDGKLDRWNSDAHLIAEIATKEWVRMSPGESTYLKTTCPLATDLAEPSWPGMPFDEVMQLALRERVITSIDHPVLQKLLKGAVKK
jgi:hypothetical protein